MSDMILDQEQVSSGYENNYYASFWNRVGATLVDGLIFIPVVGLNYYNMYYSKSIFLMLILSVVYIIYKIYMEGQYGATFGKMALKIKIIDQNRESINFEKSVMRNSLYIIGAILGVMVNYNLFTHPDFIDATTFLDMGMIQQEIGYGFFEILNGLFGLVILISILFVLAENRQALHDRFANTFCIMV